jgi:hypothetical protein
MKLKAFATLLALSLIYPAFLMSQDLIIKRSNDTIQCKVKEVGMDEIKYALPDYPDDVVFSLDKDRVQKVIFSNGKELTFKQDMIDPDNYADNKKNAWKIDFISPLTGNTTLGFEHSLKPGRSVELSLGIIGAGVNVNDDDAAGVFVKFGYKFIKSPDYYLRGMRYAHILKGGYVRPEFQFGLYSTDEYIYDYGYGYSESIKRVDVFTGAFLLNIGKQWVYDNSFLVDFYVGVGYGFDTNKYNYGDYHYGFLLVDEDVPISFSAGLKIGFLSK